MNAMQLLVRYDFDAFDAWKEGYDRHAEARGQAGMRQLQLWREGEGSVWGLYDVSDSDKAAEHLDTLGRMEGSVAARHALKTI